LKPFGRSASGRRCLVRLAGRPTDENRAQEAAPAALVSIVLPTFGQLEMTRLCLPRLLRQSRSPFEVVVVDGGSMDGTAEYLAGVADVGPARLHVVRSEDDLDVGSACALGVAQVKGGLVALLANDALVPEGWLNHLTGLLRLAGDMRAASLAQGFMPKARRGSTKPACLLRPRA
jgi:glycosyltransferase involved in cell wall biosynthesis